MHAEVWHGSAIFAAPTAGGRFPIPHPADPFRSKYAVNMAEEGRQIIYNMVQVGKTLPTGKTKHKDKHLGFY
jgi:hypothetical protein